MEIKQYDYETRIKCLDFIKKYNKSESLNILNGQTFFKGKKIFLMVEKEYFNRCKIIGYAIIYENLQIASFFCNINKQYAANTNTIFISDFMIDYPYRKQRIGKYLARYIINEVYKEKNIILQPEGDGNWFWDKFGFVSDNISSHLTLILKREKDK